jgi:HTH-type transcriptional regulator / antitoxin MqsA
MQKCEICGGSVFHREDVEEVFHIGERYMLVEHIPAMVCAQCGEKTFDAATVEEIRKRLHEKENSQRKVEMDVYAY